jgi:hypothetical protein
MPMTTIDGIASVIADRMPVTISQILSVIPCLVRKGTAHLRRNSYHSSAAARSFASAAAI